MTQYRTSIFTIFCLYAAALLAQAPAGYYAAADGKTGAALKTAFCQIINPHEQRSYKDLWTDFRSTDARPDGKVWDMYSCVTNYTFGTDQAGNYKQEGDVYNREHSFPKSWFNDECPMYTDLFHLYPTDGYVNGRRSNYPFGEVAKPEWSSAQGFCKLGKCTYPGYSGTAFESADEYKGDFARTYFYMITCYEDRISQWNCEMLDGAKYPGFSSWALSMLMKWAKEDPVSEKETDRNEAVYIIQDNRNPFIDFPGLEEYIWGSTTTTFSATNYSNPYAPTGLGTVLRETDACASYSLSGTLTNHSLSPQGIYITRGAKFIRR